MRLSLIKPLSFGLFLLPALLVAQELQPGLWEVSTNQMQVGGKAAPGMDQMLKELQNLPPEQRQMMEQMLAGQGVQLGDKGLRLCMSEQQAKGQEIPLQDPDSGCQHEITEKTPELWKFRITCPEGQGVGETHFVSDKEFITRISGTYSGQSSSMENHANWISADCGTLKAK